MFIQKRKKNHKSQFYGTIRPVSKEKIEWPIKGIYAQ